MHHLRKVRDLKRDTKLDFFSKQMAAINRKQVPLCKEHHKKLHSGNMTQEEKDGFNKGCREFAKSATSRKKEG